MTPVLAFDIETVPDCAGIRKLYDLPDTLADAEVVRQVKEHFGLAR